MKSAWCAVLAVGLCSTAWARTPDGDEKKSDKSASETPSQVEVLSAELKAQRAELEAQRALIDSLKAQQLSAPKMSLEGAGDPMDPNAQAKPTLAENVKSKWAMNIYGFVETDFIEDSHQLATAATAGAGQSDTPGNNPWPLGHQYATTHGELTYGARNSRIGFNGSAPEYAGIRVSAKLEMDFEGTNGGGTASSNATWTNPTFRIRHMYITLDNDYVTVTLGQGWELFGWQPFFMPNTVDIQGVAGEVYSRSPKIQFSHKFQGPVDIELAAALSRPPEREANSPDIQAGIKVSIPDWVGVHTVGATGTAIDGAAFGISGTSRKFQVPNDVPAAPALANIVGSDAVRGDGVALDAFLPILHPEKESKANSLSFTGELVYGKGITDLYTGFNGGAQAIPGVQDAGEVGYQAINPPGVGIPTNFDLKAIQWRTSMVGIQYYLPPDGGWWISANWSECKSNNILKVGTLAAGVFTPNGSTLATEAFRSSRWINVNLFYDITPSVRLGLSGDQYRDDYGKMTIGGVPFGSQYGYDTRFQFSAWFIF